MKRINAEELEEYVGSFLATYRENNDGIKKIVYAKVISVHPKEHKIVLEQTNNLENLETNLFSGYYRDDNEVEVYEEDEAVLLALKDFD